MELEQINKRLEWLDDERRKDKNTISLLEEKLLSLEGTVSHLQKKVNEQESEISHLTGTLARFDQIETSLSALRIDLTRNIETIEKQFLDQQNEAEKIRRGDLESINKSFAEIRKSLEVITEIKKNVQARVEEDFRLSRLIDELERKVIENQRSEEEYHRAQRLLDENRRQDAKRLADLQVEVAALRKRGEEQRGKVDVATDNVRRIEVRVNEIQNAEAERKQILNTFIERQNLLQVDRDRIWKEWENTFEDFKKQASTLDIEMQNVDAALRTIKRSQEAFDEITQTFDRRINELTEMQRLAEDRFRQEWVGFKADDQKRWTNYSLSTEEQQREIGRQMEKHANRLVSLEDLTLEMKDMIHQMNLSLKNRLQMMLDVSQKWVEDFERNIGKID